MSTPDDGRFSVLRDPFWCFSRTEQCSIWISLVMLNINLGYVSIQLNPVPDYIYRQEGILIQRGIFKQLPQAFGLRPEPEALNLCLFYYAYGSLED